VPPCRLSPLNAIQAAEADRPSVALGHCVPDVSTIPLILTADATSDWPWLEKPYRFNAAGNSSDNARHGDLARQVHCSACGPRQCETIAIYQEIEFALNSVCAPSLDGFLLAQ
jgi:hypothetical protein